MIEQIAEADWAPIDVAEGAVAWSRETARPAAARRGAS